jgi:hypothetical protein
VQDRGNLIGAMRAGRLDCPYMLQALRLLARILAKMGQPRGAFPPRRQSLRPFPDPQAIPVAGAAGACIPAPIGARDSGLDIRRPKPLCLQAQLAQEIVQVLLDLQG